MKSNVQHSHKDTQLASLVRVHRGLFIFQHAKRLAYWPPSELTKHLKEGALPDRHTWTLQAVCILGSKDEYLVARRKVDNSQYTSNLDTTDADSTKG